jgi:hypothetical protein
MKTKIIYTLTFLIGFILIGCSAPIPEPVKITPSTKKVDFLTKVKPILDKRCVTCHSCYNSPCQAKFSSYEGIDRGGSKLLVYDALRLSAAKPTRLFEDAQTTLEWREKGFFSLTQNFDANSSYNDSIMMHMLHDKKVNPKVIGSYKPESDKLICPRNKQEMGNYLEDKPNHGMPYGFPALKDKEYETLTQWVAQGAYGPTHLQQAKLVTPSHNALHQIIKWETFLNDKNAKHKMTSRYLYEHLFLAHWHFTNTQKEFYKLVRSKTPYPQDIKIIPTDRPFDDPKVDIFYYRLQKIHATIVHKTHMVVEFNDEKLARIKELFIQPQWLETPHVMSYDSKQSANPFVTFAQIPPRSRYQFLLNNAEYTIRTFIRGPVCRGQIALNVINDHFWVMFKDPNSDISILHPEFLVNEAENLSMPIQTSSKNIFDSFSDAYREKYKTYFEQKQIIYNQFYPQGQGIDSIWKGENKNDAPLLTIYRHFDSATVLKGVIGALPRTVWVIDYPQFERIYYSLVAGYNVFGNLSHQINIRRYMDFLRIEGELNFLYYMPNNIRSSILHSWYLNTDLIEDIVGDDEDIVLFKKKHKLIYNTKNPKVEFVSNVVNKHILKSTNIDFDSINYHQKESIKAIMPTHFSTLTDVKNGLKALVKLEPKFIQYATDDDINTIFIKIVLANNKNFVTTLVINRWHDNVDSIFRESNTLNPAKDTVDFLPYSASSYPNAFAIVHYNELSDFFDLLQKFDDSQKYKAKIDKYFIRRSNPKFWETYDWFQDDFNTKNPIEAGLYDLNRYYHK